LLNLDYLVKKGATKVLESHRFLVRGTSGFQSQGFYLSLCECYYLFIMVEIRLGLVLVKKLAEELKEVIKKGFEAMEKQ